MMERPAFWNTALAIVCAAIVGAAFVLSGFPWWIAAAGLIATAAWVAASQLLRSDHLVAGAVCAIVAILGGSFVAGPTNGLSLVPAAVGALLLIARIDLPVWIGVTAAVAGFVILTGGIAGLAPAAGPGAVLTMGLGLAIGVLAGFVRRSTRREAAEAQRVDAERIAAREAQGRIALARDLHDVLAHSLGGLALQLDAVDALLEAGRIDEARARVTAARTLAGQGLADARGAVEALRAPVDDAALVDTTPAIEELLGAHAALGATAALDLHGRPRPVPAAIADAVVRAVQESLSNARRHAPGAATDVRIAWTDTAIDLRVANDVPATPAEPGGRYGLRGMAERFAALPIGGWARAETVDGRFIVTAHAALVRTPTEEGR